MLCQKCNKRTANIEITQIINGVRTQSFLCQECASASELAFSMPTDFNSFFTEITNHLFDLNSTAPQINIYKCKSCGLPFDTFKETGKLGCSDCYSSFESQLEPILKRLHGSIKHVGKRPKASQNNDKDEINDLKQKLQDAIRKEKYEDAAKYRDRIKKLEEQKGGEM